MGFLIETFLAESSIPNIGKGVFTQVEIKKDQPIWRLTSETTFRISPGSLKTLYNSYNKGGAILLDILKYSYLSGDDLIFIADNGRFYNHSDKPNCYSVGDVTYALRDIKAGEELFEDYRTYGRLSPFLVDLHNEFNIWHPHLD